MWSRSYHTETVLDAPPEAVWHVLTDFDAYPLWNPLVAQASGALRAGAMLDAHTRIASILRKAEEVGFSFGDRPDLSLLTQDAEQTLIKELLRFPDAVRQAAEAREPHRVATYLREAAVAFTQFYAHCHIIGEERPLATARMHLAKAAQVVLRNGLVELLGVEAPERMYGLSCKSSASRTEGAKANGQAIPSQFARSVRMC